MECVHKSLVLGNVYFVLAKFANFSAKLKAAQVFFSNIHFCLCFKINEFSLGAIYAFYANFRKYHAALSDDIAYHNFFLKLHGHFSDWPPISFDVLRNKRILPL